MRLKTLWAALMVAGLAAACGGDGGDSSTPTDTTSTSVTLAGVAYGQTVLARACAAAGIPFDNREAHSALYDTKRTAELYCAIVNQWWEKIGPPPLVEGDDAE